MVWPASHPPSCLRLGHVPLRGRTTLCVCFTCYCPHLSGLREGKSLAEGQKPIGLRTLTPGSGLHVSVNFLATGPPDAGQTSSRSTQTQVEAAGGGEDGPQLTPLRFSGIKRTGSFWEHPSPFPFLKAARLIHWNYCY